MESRLQPVGRWQGGRLDGFWKVAVERDSDQLKLELHT
jgi:hypothetical protein